MSDTSVTKPPKIGNFPNYSQTFGDNMRQCERIVVSCISDCAVLRSSFIEAIDGLSWYNYQNESRKILDTVNLVEHDLSCLVQQINNIRAANWKAYYREHPNE